MPIIVIIDDDALGGSITKNQIEDIFVGIEVRLLTDKDDILGFQPTDENLLIVDQHLFDSFNHRSEKVDGFPSGTELAKICSRRFLREKLLSTQEMRIKLKRRTPKEMDFLNLSFATRKQRR